MSIFTVIKSSDEFDKAINENEICVIDFFATWCGPCKTLSEKLNELVKNNNLINSNKSIKFIKVDVDEFEDIAVTYKISSLPHVIFYKNGKLSNLYVTGCYPDKIISIINQLLNS